MNKVGLLLRVIREAEVHAARDLLRLGERHKADHDVYHLTRDLAGWSLGHVELVAASAKRYGVNLSPEAGDQNPLAVIREKAGELLGRRTEPGLVLLRDLRKLHLDLIGLSTDWELLAQTAQGRKDDHLLALAQRCHPDTLRQARWTNAKIKESAPQIMAQDT
jgi:hypothetical protein